MKFKKGDKVKRIKGDNTYDMELGNIYTIREYCAGIIHLEECTSGGYSADYFELVDFIPQRVITDGYPKWMIVGDDKRRLVLCHNRNDTYPYVYVDKSFIDNYINGDKYQTLYSKTAKEIEEPTTKKMTVKEISDKLGYDIEIVKGWTH